MTETVDRVCVTCGAAEDVARLEQCTICRKPYCADCAHKAGHGRRFCSPECARAYYFSGEPDDDEDHALDD
jgi:hypothetical protein